MGAAPAANAEFAVSASFVAPAEGNSTLWTLIPTFHSPREAPLSIETPASTPKPPSQHELALMIWLAVTPTLLVINLALGPVLAVLPVVPRTIVVVTIAVPIVIYAVMPTLHRLRRRLLARRTA